MLYLAWFLIILFLMISFVTLFFYSSLVIGLIQARGVPFVSLPKKDWKRMCLSAEVREGQTVFDLGCGKANLLITAVKDFKAKGVGYEISLWPYFLARIRNWYYKTNLDLRLSNFLKADLSSSDVIFCYLFPYVMGDLEKKFEKELKSGTKVVCYAFKLPNRIPDKIIDSDVSNGSGKIYIYIY